MDEELALQGWPPLQSRSIVGSETPEPLLAEDERDRSRLSSSDPDGCLNTLVRINARLGRRR